MPDADPPSSQQSQQPLAGIRVGVPATRRAVETAALIRRWGGEPVVGPLLEEVPVADEAALRAATQAALASPVTWSVHLTGVGTRRWFARAEAWGLLPRLLDQLRSARIVARGQKTSAVLAEHGLGVHWTPPEESSAAITRWLVPQLGPQDRVVVQLFGEPATTLLDALAATGAQVIEVAPYVWDFPSDPAQREAGRHLVHAIGTGDVQALVLTSAVQATHLFAVARLEGMEAEVRRALTEAIFTAAVGETAAGGLQREGVAVDLIASPARMGALVRALAEAAPAVRAKAGLA